MDDWINQGTRTWNADAIQEALDQTDAATVLQIHLPLNNRPDILRWPATTDGRTTVRSTYHAIQTLHLEDGDRGASRTPNLWKVVWKARVWPKLQVFMWRLGTNSIVTKVNLVQRGVQTAVQFPSCSGNESRKHLFLECNWVQ